MWFRPVAPTAGTTMHPSQMPWVLPLSTSITVPVMNEARALARNAAAAANWGRPCCPGCRRGGYGADAGRRRGAMATAIGAPLATGGQQAAT